MTPRARFSTGDDALPAVDGPDLADAIATEPDARTRERRGPAAERRSGMDTRDESARSAAGERRSGFDRRRGPGRRRTDFRRAAEDGHMNDEQLDFLRAIDEYKRVNNKPYPTLTEVLDVALYLGYRRVAPVGEFKLCKGRQTPPRMPKGGPSEA